MRGASVLILWRGRAQSWARGRRGAFPHMMAVDAPPDAVPPKGSADRWRVERRVIGLLVVGEQGEW
jgi:hypothetical protein